MDDRRFSVAKQRWTDRRLRQVSKSHHCQTNLGWLSFSRLWVFGSHRPPPLIDPLALVPPCNCGYTNSGNGRGSGCTFDWSSPKRASGVSGEGCKPRDVADGNGPFFNAASRHRVLASAWRGIGFGRRYPDRLQAHWSYWTGICLRASAARWLSSHQLPFSSQALDASKPVSSWVNNPFGDLLWAT
jgi:hypothetical protein